ncbi:hypothetical protein FE783_21740 [Paenibacillus mesophilus]|uniref:hypothetical protein n=1 Tax=Paenibacillus mesophilus TaxID=2582849 RepID=UPI00110E0FC5|nr:hypothetical protein [Paenibacillus mesophilus]TMV47615.1 hypothetical protein FE783_21740 [Paenibacillus mesophilus]
MDKQLLSYVGGILGGYVLTELPLSGTFLSGVEQIIDGVGVLSMILFSGTLIYKGIKTLWGK